MEVDICFFGTPIRNELMVSPSRSYGECRQSTRTVTGRVRLTIMSMQLSEAAAKYLMFEVPRAKYVMFEVPRGCSRTLTFRQIEVDS